MSKVYILSTMANSVNYRTYRMVGDQSSKAGILPVPQGKDILIRGGADRPSQKVGFGDASNDINGNVIWTPRGVVTTLSQEDYDRVKEHEMFKKHVAGGYLAVVDGAVAESHKKVVRKVEDMREAAQDATGDETAGQDRSKPLNKDTIAQRIKVRTPQVGDSLSQEWS